jgi:HAD superfamily hydrolase (TIGR01549 family)
MSLHKKKYTIFFDLGQTLVNEWDFIDYFDRKFVEVLNGFGTRIDIRNYKAVRDNVIRSRRIGTGYIREIIVEVCQLISQTGYGEIIARKLEYELNGVKRLFHFFDDVEQTMKDLSEQYDLGIISNESRTGILYLLKHSYLKQFFSIIVVHKQSQMKNPDLRIFEKALSHIERHPRNCIMIGDRLDTDISPANKLEIKTIRTLNSLFKLQEPLNKFEHPTFTVTKLSEIPNLLRRTGLV